MGRAAGASGWFIRTEKRKEMSAIDKDQNKSLTIETKRYAQGGRMFQQTLHTFCVKQLMRAAAHLFLSSITPLIVFAVFGVISAAPAHAQSQDIDSFVGCLNSIATPNATVADAAACLPSSCYTTVTLSQESAQPACTLVDGTRLPRVIFSCQGPGGSQTLRFRPSFSLCTLGASPSSSVINHIEVGEDSGVVVDSQKLQKMGDITLPTLVSLTNAGVQTNNADPQTGCANCHDVLATVGGINLFAPIRPALSEGTIYSNDPSVRAPAVQTPLSAICTGIQNSTYLFVKHLDRYNLALRLCNALEPKTH
ncbi:MAG: hypothetical protein DMG60_21885 [Acidobacteria bacterium]|nr:MAG: hypothetical protein DMG60_21885 [Acidobacteriota bacterium]